MSFKALVYAYVIGGFTFIPLVIIAIVFFAFSTSVTANGAGVSEAVGGKVEEKEKEKEAELQDSPWRPSDANDFPRTRRGWLIMRRTFEESAMDGSYVTMVRSFLDARSKDPKRSRPKDMWYVVLKGKVLFLYEDESMVECEVAIELGGHDVTIYPDALLDGELFTRRNAICLKPKNSPMDKAMPREDDAAEDASSNARRKLQDWDKSAETKAGLNQEASHLSMPWFIFVRSVCDMEDWYLALVHASEYPPNTPMLSPLRPIFDPADMENLVSTLDAQPDVIPMRWLNAVVGRLFLSYYRTQALETFVIGRLMKKLSKVKRPAFLTDIVVTEVSVGNKAPMFSKPMLKELTKEGDASIEVHLQYKGEFRITVEATATINLGARFKSYTVKLVLAAVLKQLEGNMLVKVKRPPSNRIWYAFTQTPKMVLEVEPIVSDRQITWGMILSTIEARLKEIIQESVVMPNMDDIAFFETAPHERRGGIWPHLRRHRRMSPLAATAQDISVPSADDQEPLSPTSIDVVPPSSPRPLSATEPTHATGSPLPSPAARPVTVSGGEDISALTDDHADPWFLDAEARDASLPTQDDAERSGDVEQPTVWEGPQPYSEDGGRTVDDQSSFEAFLAPHHIRRSVSQTSLSAGSVEGNNAGQRDSSSARVAKPPSTPPNHKSSRSTSGSPSNAASFLATLKARAGDKEALSKTAKETMRKWGVNWAGLRRDNQDQTEDAPDHGAAYSRAQNEIGNLAQKARASYAEVRAVVAEWKDREQRSIPEAPSNPRPVANITRNGSRRGSQTPSQIADDITSWNSFPEEGSTSDKERSQSGDPSLSRSTTRSQSTRQSEGPRDFPESTPDLASPSIAIHTQQPSQARTMIIPGIHASHRGEVMSMGYVAPSSSAESKSKSPAMQSVYRLWKNSLPSESAPLIPADNGREAPSPGNADGHGVRSRGITYGDPARLVAQSDPPPLPRRSSIAGEPRYAQLTGPQSDIDGDAPAFRAEPKSTILDDPVESMIAEPAPARPGSDLQRSATSPPPLPPRGASVSS